jgi:uncharacterized protein with FMN-binding domain
LRRIAIAVAATVSVVVLLFSYRTSTGPGPVATGRPLGDGTQPTGTTSPATPGSVSGTFTGGAADTRYGPVQVRITVSGGKITDAQAVENPQETGRDVRIKTAAVPVLNQETLQAQSAQIDTDSGATYTSEGYQQSLQSAIDAAHG